MGLGFMYVKGEPAPARGTWSRAGCAPLPRGRGCELADRPSRALSLVFLVGNPASRSRTKPFRRASSALFVRGISTLGACLWDGLWESSSAAGCCVLRFGAKSEAAGVRAGLDRRAPTTSAGMSRAGDKRLQHDGRGADLRDALTTDCTGYATSRLSDDSGRTLNSLRRLCGVRVRVECVCVCGEGGARSPPRGGITSLSPAPLTHPLSAGQPSSPLPSSRLLLCAPPGTRASPPPPSSSWVPSLLPRSIRPACLSPPCGALCR